MVSAYSVHGIDLTCVSKPLQIKSLTTDRNEKKNENKYI